MSISDLQSSAPPPEPERERQRKGRQAKRKGANAELRCIRILEAAGYCCTKAGGSLGLFDVIAIGPQGVRAVQVKSGKRPWLSPLEREQIALLSVPENVSKELWKFPDYCRNPLIEVL